VVRGLGRGPEHGGRARVGQERRVVRQLLGPAPDLDEVAVADRIQQGDDHPGCVVESSAAAGEPLRGRKAGESAIRRVITDAGFTRFRRAAQTPFNLVYEVRP
jgi:hypothetical protein